MPDPTAARRILAALPRQQIETLQAAITAAIEPALLAIDNRARDWSTDDTITGRELHAAEKAVRDALTRMRRELFGVGKKRGDQC